MAPREYATGFHGDNLPSGTYFYQLKVDQHLLTKKMTLLK